ncbi:MAG: hypothetical protein CMJ76_00440 [Planctomycetaceae bacterium]|nr:hypothetical protein [Planctomycetaceae bacterium]|tara:strand:+ start:4114 stop:5373 length:1260 start_codon:yes stop_codon:yes gene_type:complete
MKFSLNSLTLLLILFVSTAAACLWDTDTLSEEMSESPNAIELVTGAFPRHSEAFYRWRIEDRQAKLEQGDDEPLHYDDIAVAFDKLDQHEEAIQWMKHKQEKYPDKYETYANLGTFHIHNGNFPEGIRYIEKALEINPAAHFNRERYQLYVVRYLQYRSEHGQFKEGKLLLPLSRDPYEDERSANIRNRHKGGVLHAVPAPGINNFYTFIADDLADKTVNNYNPQHVQISKEQTAEAIQGILGMMRFGHHDSPILLECLADLLTPKMSDSVGNRIAARALLKASYEVNDEVARKMFYDKASDAIYYQKGLEINPLEKAFKRELSQADEYYAELVALEKSWIESGKNVDAEFRKKYYQRDKNGETLAYFPVEFKQIASISNSQTVKIRPKFFVALASLILGVSITAHLLIKVLSKFKRGV